jgi:xylulokinase
MNDENKHILAIDLGTGGPKAALTTLSGRVVAEAFVPTPLVHTSDGGIEQDAQGWLEAIARACAQVAAKDPQAARGVCAVGVASQWFATVAVDADGAPLMNAISWMDSRGAKQIKQLAGPGPRVSGYNPRKLVRWLRMTGGAPSLQGHDSLAHVHLIREINPDVYERTRAFIDPGGFITTALTGRLAMSAEAATAFWATDTRPIDNIAYDSKLLALGKLDAARMPELVPSGSVVGELTAEWAARLGVAPVPVVAATPDIMAAAIGSGAVADFAPHLYVGTSGWLACHVPFKKTDPFHNIAALPSALSGRYLMCTEQQCAGETLAHLRDRLLVTDSTFDELTAEAATIAPGSDGVLFTPWLNGERTPLDDNHARAAYANLSLTSTRAALVRATLEGVALNARWMQEHSERFAGRRLDDIALIGGGAQSDLWCQIFADVLDRRVRRIAQPRQATARGAALHAAIGIGAVTPAEVSGLVAAEKTYEPEAGNQGLYDELFDRFKSFYKANRRLYKQFNAGTHRPRNPGATHEPDGVPK